MKTLLQCARTWIDFLEQTGLNPGSPVHVNRVSGTGTVRVNLGFVEGGRHNRVGYLNMSTKAGKGILDAPATAAPLWLVQQKTVHTLAGQFANWYMGNNSKEST